MKHETLSMRIVLSVCVDVTALPSLVTLVLENTAVTDAGLRRFTDCAASAPLLKNLDLSRTNVTQDCFTALQGTRQDKFIDI